MVSAKKGLSFKFFVHYLFFGTSKLFSGQVQYGHKLVPGQV